MKVKTERITENCIYSTVTARENDPHVSIICRGCLFEKTGCSSTIDPNKNTIKNRINISSINPKDINQTTNCGILIKDFVSPRLISSTPVITSLVK